jgi:hypothetical protein
VGAGLCERIVAGDVGQGGQERVALVRRRADEAADGVPGGAAGDELATAHGQRAEQQQALIGFGQAADEGGQAFQDLRLVESMGRQDGWQLAAPQQGGLDEQVSSEGIASVYITAENER